MKHALEKFDSIQDASGRIPADEPVFLLRARDPIASTCVRAWAMMYAFLGGDKARAEKVYIHATRMDNWKPKKLPGV